MIRPNFRPPNLRLPCLPYETFHLFHRGEIMFFIFLWGADYMPLKAKINVSIKIATSRKIETFFL
jgi:hypothetical protein